MGSYRHIGVAKVQINDQRPFLSRHSLEAVPSKGHTKHLKTTSSGCLLCMIRETQASSPDSAIIIDEMIIPNQGAHARSTQIDMIMMTSLASMGRTEKQWDSLLAAAGLKVLEKRTYAETTGESIIVAVPKA